MTPDTDLTDGQFAYDVTKQSLVRVTSTDEGTVGEQEPAMKELIERAEGNRAVGFDDETRCIEVAYVGIDSGDRQYTIPETRIETSARLVTAAAALASKAGVLEDVAPALAEMVEADLGDDE